MIHITAADEPGTLSGLKKIMRESAQDERRSTGESSLEIPFDLAHHARVGWFHGKDRRPGDKQ
jgi:hypothetical protein